MKFIKFWKLKKEINPPVLSKKEKTSGNENDQQFLALLKNNKLKYERFLILLYHGYRFPNYHKIIAQEEISKEETERLFLEFLKDVLGDTYYELGKTALQNGIFRSNEEYAGGKKRGSCYNNEDGHIYIDYRNTFMDVIDYIHEFFHYMIPTNHFLAEVMGEMLPIFMETLMSSYLKEKYPNHPDLFCNDIERYQTNKNHIDIEFDIMEVHEYQGFFTMKALNYLISTVFALQMFSEYLEEPEKTLEKILNSISLFQNEGNFNQIMELFGIDIRYDTNTNQVIYDETVLANMVTNYNAYYYQTFQDMMACKVKKR